MRLTQYIFDLTVAILAYTIVIVQRLSRWLAACLPTRFAQHLRLGMTFVAFLTVLTASAVSIAKPASASRNEALWITSQALEPKALDLLEKLVLIDSGSANKVGVDAVAELVASEFASLHASVERVPSTDSQYADMLLIRVHGKGKSKILLVPHMDTVFLPGVAKSRGFHIKDDAAIGAGSGDDKQGIVAAYCAIAALQKTGFTQFDTITVLVNSQEEVGSRGSKATIESESLKHDVVFVLEGGLEGDQVKVMRKGSATIHIDITGKAAHAGVEPEKGRNALLEAARLSIALPTLQNASLKTTVNPTLLSAGSVSNVIPDHASLTADVRVQDPAEIVRLEKDLAILTQTPSIPGVTIKAWIDVSFPPFPPLASTDKLANRAKSIYHELDLSLGAGATGGAGDAGYASATGRPVLDGLGFIGGGAHSEGDYVEIHSIPSRIYLLSRMIQSGALP